MVGWLPGGGFGVSASALGSSRRRIPEDFLCALGERGGRGSPGLSEPLITAFLKEPFEVPLLFGPAANWVRVF